MLDPCHGHAMSCQLRPSPPMLLCTSLWPVMAGILTLAISIHLSTHGPEAPKTAQTSGNNMNTRWTALAVPHPLSSSTLQLASEAPKVTLLIPLSQALSLESPYFMPSFSSCTDSKTCCPSPEYLTYGDPWPYAHPACSL